MLMSICTVRDDVSQVYGRPMFVRTVGEANRSFISECSNAESELSKHPSDYSLYELGQYDDETAVFTLLPAPRLVSKATDHIQS